MLAGNVVALLSPCIFVPVLTYAFGPQKYDWKSMMLIRLGDDRDLAADAGTDLESIPGRLMGLSQEETAQEQAKLKRAGRIAGGMTVFLTVALLVLWPMPMFGSSCSSTFLSVVTPREKTGGKESTTTLASSRCSDSTLLPSLALLP